mgnify:CR=1 FL=1
MAGDQTTTIVVVDVADFSALAAADRGRAVAAVGRLIERCRACARAQCGRVFETSGDSVRMQFNSVAKGLDAAVELASDPDPPIRAAVHLGEVTELPGGDLIGPGVSVAGQMQTQARPGGVLVSEAARKALSGPLADQLIVKGVVKFDKSDETIAVYELRVEQRVGSGGAERARRLTRLGIAGGVALIALTVVAVIAWNVLRPPPAPRVAVFALTAPDDVALQTLGVGVSDDIGLALSASGTETVARATGDAVGDHVRRTARARALGARLMLDGGVEREGQATRIALTVTRVADRAELWSAAYEGEADAEAMRRRAAMEAVGVLRCAVDASRGRRNTSVAVLQLLLRACGMQGAENAAERRELLTQAVAQAPDIAIAHALLSLDVAEASRLASAAQRDAMREEARRHAAEALNLDRNLGEAYLALERIETRRNWEARETALRHGSERDEGNAAIAARHALLLAETGHMAEALGAAQRSAELNPLAVSAKHESASLMLLTGDVESAHAIADEVERTSPSDPEAWLLRLRVTFWGGRYDDALALIEARDSLVQSVRARQCWRRSGEAMRSDGGARTQTQRIAQIVDCARSGDLPAQHALMVLAALDATDDAFVLARELFVDQRGGGHQVLFAPQTRAMRRDPRFMPLMQDLGLLRHWRLSGQWPDFCREPGLPYRCDAEARRLL